MRTHATLFLVLATAVPASAQCFNIDVGPAVGAPSAAYGGAAGVAGVWNQVPVTPTTTSLLQVDGSSSLVTIQHTNTNASNFAFNNLGTAGDDQALLDDMASPGVEMMSWTILGLAPGDYSIYTYAFAAENIGHRTTVSVPGSANFDQDIGGAWTGAHVQGTTYALHQIAIVPGGFLRIDTKIKEAFASVNGFQIVALGGCGPISDLCQPGVNGVMLCPCFNPPGGAPRGCDNSSITGGAQITSTGMPSLSADTLVFSTNGEKPTATSIVLQGNALFPSGAVFGQGVRCVGGSLRRLYLKVAVGGSITAPEPGDPSVSASSTALGDVISAGENRWYAVYYRDPIVTGGCPPTSTFNVTQTQQAAWGP